jgi:hypothetical protein
MGVDRSGIHRAHTLASTLAHWHEQFRLYFLPARCGHHRNPMQGFLISCAICQVGAVWTLDES